MHIAIHTGPLTSAHSKRGIGLYTKELVEALEEHQPAHTYSHFSRSSGILTDADVIHYPFFDPFFLTLPWKSPKPTVVTCHDLIPIVFADHFPRGIRGEFKWQVQKNSLKRIADSIITDSQSSKNDIARILGYPSDHIYSIPLAARPVFQPVKDKKVLSDMKKKYKLNNKFILYVGDVNWNKNIPGLMRAFDLYAKTYSDVQLVCIGKAFIEHQVKKAANVTMPGFVSDEDLAGLYSLAQVLVYPSFAEGFGFPVLEAMACGSPVVTSDAPGLLEIAGPAITVDPHKPEDIRRGIDVVLSFSSSRRNEMIQKGFAWAKKFTWEKVAKDTVRVYEEIIHHYSGL